MINDENTGLVSIGSDIGFGTGKLYMNTGTDVIQLSHQSTVATGRIRNYKKWQEDGKFDPNKTDLENQLLTLDVEIQDHQRDKTKHLFMGRLAIQEGTDARYCWDDDKSSNEDSIATLVTMIATGQTQRVGGVDSKISAYVGTGLPIDKFFDYKLTYEQNFKGLYTVTFLSGPWTGVKCTINIVKCRPYPQAWGIYMDLTHDENGQAINPHLGKGYVLVVDPGFRTTDYALFLNGEMLDAYSDTIDLGIAYALNQVSNTLVTKGIQLDEKELDFFYMQKKGLYEMADGRVVDLNPFRDKAFALLGRKISDDLKMRLQQIWSKIQRTEVGGGGGAGLYEHLNLLEEMELVPNPQYSNARGFRKANQAAIKKALKANA